MIAFYKQHLRYAASVLFQFGAIIGDRLALCGRKSTS
jgi:hypothetical protein